ncbi:30S ribosomal protein S16 [Candidatus Pantoea edessiphila]|uniref:Small ribosomal subunit protein bS16 n=1 Tax=Candidatus Pantoea edessiphila TaxID=2044610 RepID=A0A2P5T1P0_9GAMM|nr:30S ribosomal protein S16 [Candidatus Pantoea edessiphila]PPI88473.1 30S ribosomal protein S16 [Candidatus Pantoea edessiphila]
MVIIRLARHGTKKRPFYQVVITDNRKARNGAFIENLGFFNPITSGHRNFLSLNLKRIEYWIDQGAQLSNKVNTLIKQKKRSQLNVDKNE